MAKTSIFISSVNDDGLKSLRKSVFRELSSLGHEPLMWEENFGPWPAHINPISKCLEAVGQSDIYLLFVGRRAGTYDLRAERTVTHMEFIKAADLDKTILIFADAVVKADFFGKAKRMIEEYVEQYMNDNRQFPTPAEITELLARQDSLPREVEPYVWYFLYDITLRGVYIDDLALGVPVDWKAYFSDLLRRGSMLLPLENTITDNSLRLEQFDQAYDVLINVLPHVRVRELGNAEAFLVTLVSRLSGGIVRQHYGGYMTEDIGTYDSCSAATLYRLQEDRLILVAKVGDAAEVAFYALSNASSYVVLTHKRSDRTDQVFFNESRHLFYYCIRMGDYVLTLHFPSGPDWTNTKFIRFKKSVIHAIINKNPLMIEFIRILLGGMQP